MSDKTSIEWTDATWNPVTGCAKVSQGCKHCYAEREWPRMTKLVPAYAGREFTDVRTHADRLDQPLRWKKPRMIFVNSMSDLFHPDVPFDFIDRVFAVMALAPQHVFQVLTKRPERMQKWLHRVTELVEAMPSGDYRIAEEFPHLATSLAYPNTDHAWPLPNVWIGVSVEDQAAADERIPLLLDTPAAVRWVSAEPLLGPVQLDNIEFERGDFINALDLEEWRGLEDSPEVQASPGKGALIDWVVVGGESGPKARPMHPAWARSLRDQCAAAGVPFLFKQWGEWLPDNQNPAVAPPHDPSGAIRIGKKSAGRLLDGVPHDGYPRGIPACN